MNKRNILDSKSLLQSTSLVAEVINYKSIILSIIISIISLGVIFFTSFLEDKSSSLYFGAITLAGILLIVGFYRLINRRNQVIYLSTNSRTMSGSLYFDKDQLDKLKIVLAATPSEGLADFEFAQTGNARLDYVVSVDSNFVAIQLFEFVPYTFEVASNLFIYEGEKAHNFSKYLLETCR